MDQRTAHFALGGAAALHQILQHDFDAEQVGQALAHIGQFALGLRAGLGAMRSILELQQFPDLVQAEAQSLGRFDEAHARQIRLAVATDAAQRPVGFLHQPLALIEADRLDVDPGGIGQDADGQCFRWFALGT